jgi:dTDP-4-dehydrorhamnose 3,5-epimerase
MKTIKTPIEDLLIFEPNVFGDERGFFYESFNASQFRKASGLDIEFVQDNHSRSSRGILRGLHYQLPPKAQGKLVRVVVGEVFDVAVDIRQSSPTFGQWHGVMLSAENKRQFWIPPGFAHGFITLSDNTEFLYKTTDFYSPSHERCISWNDLTLAIDWPFKEEPQLSAKDKIARNFINAEVFS